MTKLVKSAGTGVASQSPLQLYLKEIARYPLLSPEEEYELARKHHEEGDIKAAHRLITANLRLVVKIANDFRKVQTNLLDLIQEGNTGLMQAVKKFNPYKGVKLSSYSAWWIRAYILKYLLDNESQVKLATTAAQRKLFYNLRSETEKLLKQYDHVDTKQIAESLDVPEKDVIEMQKRLSGKDVSLDAEVQNDGGRSVTRGELMADARKSSIEEEVSTAEIRSIFSEHLEEFRATLKGRDVEVFDERILAEAPLTLQELGDRYGVSRERARQIENKIIQNLKTFVKERGVIDIE